MYQKQAFEAGNKGGCGPMGRGQAGFHPGRGNFKEFWKRHAAGSPQAPINIEESDTDYVISLYAAGLSKDKVKLAVKEDVLTISYPSADPASASERSYTYQEYTPGGFERSFRLNDKVISDQISASYAEGILTVRLPKNPATNQPAQTITVD